jgi:pullulanase/glycogen debranching enzyme
VVRLEPDPGRDELHEFTRRLIALRRNHPVFRRERFLAGRETMGSGLPDAWWFRSDGRKMTRRDWQSGEPVLGLFLNGEEIPNPGPARRGHRGRLLPPALQRPRGRSRHGLAVAALRYAVGI